MLSLSLSLNDEEILCYEPGKAFDYEAVITSYSIHYTKLYERGEWHDAAVPLGGAYFGCRSRLTRNNFV